MQQPSVNVPMVITTFQMNVYSHFITEFGGILPPENMSDVSSICVKQHRFEIVWKQAQKPLNLI